MSQYQPEVPKSDRLLFVFVKKRFLRSSLGGKPEPWQTAWVAQVLGGEHGRGGARPAAGVGSASAPRRWEGRGGGGEKEGGENGRGEKERGEKERGEKESGEKEGEGVHRGGPTGAEA